MGADGGRGPAVIPPFHERTIMQAEVIQAFDGRPDHEPLTRRIVVGEIIHGELAVVAVREKWASEICDRPVARRRRATAS